MSGRPRRTLLRAPSLLADDSEKLMSSSTKKSNDPETDLARSRPQSYPKLSPASQPALHHDYSANEITSVPAPIPDTGLPPPSTDTTKAVLPSVSPSSSYESVAAKASSTRSRSPSKSTFVPLPSLKTQNLTEIEEEAARSSLPVVSRPTSIITPMTVTTATSTSHDSIHQSKASHLSTTAIIALAVAGGLTLFVVLALVKLTRRPRRRKTPTPSLPILRDGTFLHDKVESDGSPLFGGKERSSPTLQVRGEKDSTGVWTWTQYNSGIPKPAPIVTITRSSSRDQLPSGNPVTQRCDLGVTDNGQYPGQYPFIGYGNSSAISKTKSLVPLQPVQSAITRAVSRLSTISMSLYPNSPGGCSQVAADVGLAIGGVTNDEPTDGAAPNYRERVMARNRMSAITPDSTKDAAALRRSQSFAYGGIETVSPSTQSPNREQFNRGRARIKSTHYTPSSHSRTSAATTNYGKHDGINLEKNGAAQGETRQRRDLTVALGPTSPVPSSPQPTLYPDDSMSVIGEAKKVTLTGRNQKKPVPKASSRNDSPPSETTTLGNLMMVDFAVSKSTASLVNIRPSEAARAREGQGSTVNGQAGAGKSSLKKRVEDKPPRVPSPPPIPSLAQMAMEQADPEGYAEYHSPTYSIYGLYDGDRKSRGLSCGY